MDVIVSSAASTRSRHRFPRHGALGLIIIFISEMLLFLNVSFVGLYFTPLVWTGYILFVDALNVFKNGNSLIIHRRREFILMLPWSIVCWVIFEMYNLHL